MSTHFTRFTAEAMRALGQQLADGAQARAAFRARLREQVTSMMEQLRRDAEQAEQARCERVAQDAEARRAFARELRASVQAMMQRFALSRGERIAAFQELAGEYRAARQAFRDRSTSPAAEPASGAAPQASQTKKA